MWYKKIFYFKKSFNIFIEMLGDYVEWFNEALISRKGKVFIKTFLYFTLPVVLMLHFGFLDKSLNRELLRTYSLVYKETKGYFKDFITLDIDTIKSKEDFNIFLKQLVEHKPKLIIVDNFDTIDVPSNIRFVKTVSLPLDLNERPRSWSFTNSSQMDKFSFVIQDGVEKDNVRISLGKNIYAGGFLQAEPSLDFKYYIKTKNRLYFSLPLAVVNALETWDNIFLKKDIIYAHKRKDNKTRSLYLGNGVQRLNPFHNLDKIKQFTKVENLKNKILVISDTKHRNIQLMKSMKVSRAQYIVLASQELYNQDLLPRIPKWLITFMLILLVSTVSVLNLFYKKRYRFMLFVSIFGFYVILSFFFMKVAQLYLGFLPVLVPYSFAYFYGIFFTNRDDVSMSKGERNLVLLGIDLIPLDRHLNQLKKENEINDFYSVIDTLRQKIINLSTANAVVESFDYSNIVFFLLEKENKLYPNFWESFQKLLNDLDRMVKTYENIPHPRMIGIEGTFHFYPEDNFWTGEGKDSFYKIRKHTKLDLVFDINIIPNGFLTKEYSELKKDGYKLYGRDI